MNENDQIIALLREIRDNQERQIGFSREQATLMQQEAKSRADDVARSIANQEQAMAMQRATAKLYRRVVFVLGIVGSAAVALGIVSFISSG